jgi:uncharacterized protein (TIGR04255 family)
MVKRGTSVPKKLKQDAIIEAVVEFRFESETIPEVFLGRLIDHPYWKGWLQTRLPAYEVPPQIRRINPLMQFAPIIQLAQAESKAALRIGPSVVSFHRLAPYVGWAAFKPELERVVDGLFAKVENPKVTRIGFRYLNALRPAIHHISAIADLDLSLTVSDVTLLSNVNLNFTTNIGPDTSCTVRIATKEFIQGPLPPDTSVYVDVDVFTNEGFSASDNTAVNKWVEFAHTQEKAAFFSLFRQPTIDELREE